MGFEGHPFSDVMSRKTTMDDKGFQAQHKGKQRERSEATSAMFLPLSFASLLRSALLPISSLASRSLAVKLAPWHIRGHGK